jgi:hypothetical protein
MIKQIEAMKLALEALEQWNTPLYKRGIAITALREALMSGTDGAEQFCDTHCTWLDHHPDCDKAEQPAPAQQEIDWKDQYEKQKRRADMWASKYEADIGPLEKAVPVTAQQGHVSWERFMAVEKELQDMTAEFMRVASDLASLRVHHFTKGNT